MSPAESSSEFSSHGASSLDGIGSSFVFIDVPKGEASGIKVGDLGDANVWANVMILSNVYALVGQERCKNDDEL